MWRWSLVRDGETVCRMRATLSDDEGARANAFVFERDRRRFIVAHARMRELLAAYAGGGRILFGVGPNGKPELQDTPHLRFSLSHSHELALLAVAREVDVGVDVEAVRPIAMEIGERFFSKAEQEALRNVAPQQRLFAFYSCWTRKEAFLKALGVGLERDLGSFTVSIAQDAPAITYLHDDDTACWSLSHLEPTEGYVGALAARATGMSVRPFRLE